MEIPSLQKHPTMPDIKRDNSGDISQHTLDMGGYMEECTVQGRQTICISECELDSRYHQSLPVLLAKL